MGVHIHPWAFGFKQSGLSHIVQMLRSEHFHAFSAPPLYVHALVPISFRIRVSTFISASFPETLTISDGDLLARDMAHKAYEGFRAHPPITCQRLTQS
jgi:hypothetical protein